MKVIFIIFILYIVLYCIISSFKENYKKRKGKDGEREIKHIIQNLPEVYTIFNDVLINVNDKYCQIDHVIVSKYGIFVIETKNYTGIITGNENDENWILQGKNQEYQFHNPIRQNYFHIKSLEQLLKTNFDKFHSIVVFTKNSNVSVIAFNSDVVNTNTLYGIIKKYNHIVYTDEEVVEIINMIKSENIKSKHIRRKFVKEKSKEYDN